jgi:hypothetical protein
VVSTAASSSCEDWGISPVVLECGKCNTSCTPIIPRARPASLVIGQSKQSTIEEAINTNRESAKYSYWPESEEDQLESG